MTLPALGWRTRLRSGIQPGSPTLRGSIGDRQLRNVLLVSHCDFTGNSALHVYRIASELRRHGFSPAIAIPNNPGSVRDLGHPPFAVLTYRDVRSGQLGFLDGRQLDLVHAFTPREHVRRLTVEVARHYASPYVVHLEDNEEAIVAARRPGLFPEFVAKAAGVTVVIDRLLEFKPDEVPGAVVWPGFDDAALPSRSARNHVRAELGLAPEDLVLVYNGNIHESNVDEVTNLYRAISLLRRRGHPAVLVKTGWNFVPRSRLPKLGVAIVDLGWVARRHMAGLLSAADVLVQPGRPGPFDDFRFPSKVPEFLASGRPVVLPRTNIGLHLADGAEAFLLERGDADEICEKVAELAEDPERRSRVGSRGRAFALRELRWSKNVEKVVDLYARVSASSRRS